MRYKNELGSSASKTRFVSQVLHIRGEGAELEIENGRKRTRSLAKRREEVAARHTTETEGTAPRDHRADWPLGQRCPTAHTSEAGEDPGARGRPTDSSARFQTAARGRRSADWKFQHDRHQQPRAGAATPRRSSPNRLRLPWRPDPHTQTPPPTEVPTRVPPPAPGTRRAPFGTRPTPPKQAAPREFDGRDAGVWQNPRP